MRDAVVCQKLVVKEDFLESLFLNNHGLLVKELNAVIFQGVHSFALVCEMYLIVAVFPLVTFVYIM
jgi:hypothetical protein